MWNTVSGPPTAYERRKKDVFSCLARRNCWINHKVGEAVS